MSFQNSCCYILQIINIILKLTKLNYIDTVCPWISDKLNIPIHSSVRTECFPVYCSSSPNAPKQTERD